jgi:hypothetical protein
MAMLDEQVSLDTLNYRVQDSPAVNVVENSIDLCPVVIVHFEKEFFNPGY